MHRFFRPTLFSLCAALTGACVLEDELDTGMKSEFAALANGAGEDDGDQSIPDQQDEDEEPLRPLLDPAWAVGPYTWSQGGAPIVMKPVNTHVCVLTRVSGDFDGGGETVKVYQSGNYWYIGGTSQQSGIGGKAYCFARDRFFASGSARWTSGDIYVWASSGGCHSYHADTWWGSATTILNGIGGKLQDGNDIARVIQSDGGFTPSIVRVDLCNGFLQAFALSFFAGTPQSGVLAKYWGSVYTANSANTCSNNDGDNEVAMGPVNDTMCHFVEIGGGGNWDGGGEFVEIYPKYSGGIERWHLRAHSGYCGLERQTIARARCYRRDQR